MLSRWAASPGKVPSRPPFPKPLVATANSPPAGNHHPRALLAQHPRLLRLRAPCPAALAAQEAQHAAGLLLGGGRALALGGKRGALVGQLAPAAGLGEHHLHAAAAGGVPGPTARAGLGASRRPVRAAAARLGGEEVAAVGLGVGGARRRGASVQGRRAAAVVGRLGVAAAVVRDAAVGAVGGLRGRLGGGQGGSAVRG